MHIQKALEAAVGPANNLFLNAVDLDALAIKAVLVNEAAPAEPGQDFYGRPDGAYSMSALSLFQKAGVQVTSAHDLLPMGVYLTNAVKSPKTEAAIAQSQMAVSLPYLEAELALFPHLQVIMLMGDVAKKAFNLLAKKATGKNALPAVSTYKLRRSAIYYQGIRLMPSYIMTGGNLLIEKSKVTMITEDLAFMLAIIQ